MSFRVVGKVLDLSEETGANRLILIVLAEAAGEDGVSWVPQKEIAAKARINATHASECIADMAARGAIEVRKVNRGRRRVAVYRLVLPGLREVEYDRLPFAMKEPFTTSEIPNSSEALTTSEIPNPSPATTSDLPSSVLVVDLEPPEVRTDDDSRELVVRDSAQPLVAAFVDLSRERGGEPGKRTIGAMSKAIVALLEEGRTPEQIHAGLERMLDKGFVSAAKLSDVVLEASLTPKRKRFAGKAPSADELLRQAVEQHEAGA